jgi:hypothetical protein
MAVGDTDATGLTSLASRRLRGGGGAHIIFFLFYPFKSLANSHLIYAFTAWID